MNAQLNIHSIRETAAPTLMQPILPAVLEQTARQVFESFSEKMKSALNGRQDRALKLAAEGHVTHKFARTFNVRSEDEQHSYLVNLEHSFCTCMDSQKGHVCKHRLAAYLVEQSMVASQQFTAQASDELAPAAPQPVASTIPNAVPDPAHAALQPISPQPAASTSSTPLPDPASQLTPQEETIEKIRLTLHARSEYMRESIIYALLPMEKGEMLPVEVIDIQDNVAMVRALPYEMHGKPVPRFPFPDRKSFAQVLAKALLEVKIYR